MSDVGLLRLMKVGLDSHRQGSLDALESLRDALGTLVAGGVTIDAASMTALVDAAIAVVSGVNGHE